MSSPYFVHDRLHAPFFMFIRDEGRYSDTDLLRRFGLATYQLTETPRRRGRYALLANDGEWTLLADDWYYTLWHMPTTRQALAELGKSCEVYACSVGDCDRSFDFIYYRDSRLVRHYVVVDPDFRGGRVAENFGEPLPGEAAALMQPDEFGIVLDIATSLGLKTDFAEYEIRAYAPPEPRGR